jgi:uroporphyrinogen-III synthase
MRQRVLVTRPEPGAARTAARLLAAGYEPVVMPLSEIVALSPGLADNAFDVAAASSANAIRHAPAALVAQLSARPLFAVGDETAVAARAAGFRQVRSSSGSAAELGRDIVAVWKRGVRLAYLCGRVRLDALESALADAGIEVIAIETYDTLQRAPSPVELAALDKAPIAVALVYSAKAAEALTELVAARQGTVFAATAFVTISTRVAERLVTVAPGRVFPAAAPEEDAMFEFLGRGHEPAAFPGSVA